MIKMMPLSKVACFQCPRAVEVFRRYYDLPQPEANDVFSQMLTWVWLNQHLKTELIGEPHLDLPEALAIFAPIKILDEMWHSFILCTRDYFSFCETFFGEYIHHAPSISFDGTPNTEDSRDLFRANVHYVMRVLGRETATLWYGRYPIEYDQTWFRDHRK